MTISRGIGVLAATVSILAGFSMEPIEAAQQSCGNLNKTEVVWVVPNVNQNVNSQTPVDVQGSTANFTVGGSANTCVIVSANVSGAAFSDAPSGQILNVQAIMDGNKVSIDGGYVSIQSPQFAYSGVGNFPGSHSWDFIFINVAPGPHTVKLQAFVTFENANQGGPESTIDNYDVLIRHR